MTEPAFHSPSPIQRQQLLLGLLHNTTYRRQYQSDPGFHNEIDAIIELVPAWVAGLAVRSQQRAVFARHAPVEFLIKEPDDALLRKLFGKEPHIAADHKPWEAVDIDHTPQEGQ